jgi:deoxyribodipyrimidine photolyase
MCESLKELSPVKLFKGDTLAILEKLHKDLQYKAVYFNESYSVYGVERDTSIKRFCEKKQIKCVFKEDYGLLPLTEGLVNGERPYTVFAPFYRKVLETPIR